MNNSSTFTSPFRSALEDCECFSWSGRYAHTHSGWTPLSGSERPCAWWCLQTPSLAEAASGRTQWPRSVQSCGYPPRTEWPCQRNEMTVKAAHLSSPRLTDFPSGVWNIKKKRLTKKGEKCTSEIQWDWILRHNSIRQNRKCSIKVKQHTTNTTFLKKERGREKIQGQLHYSLYYLMWSLTSWTTS